MKAINKTKAITLGLASFFIIGLTQPSWSFNTAKNPIEFNAISKPEQAPLFEFKANNTEAAEYLVKVMDADGNLLYSETLKGKNVTRKYRIDMTGVDVNEGFHLRFEVTDIKDKETFVYNATRKSHVIDDIVVAKL